MEAMLHMILIHIVTISCLIFQPPTHVCSSSLNFKLRKFSYATTVFVCARMFWLIISSEICVTVPSGKWKWHTIDTMGLFWLNEIKVHSKWMKLKVFFSSFGENERTLLPWTSQNSRHVPNPTKFVCLSPLSLLHC